MKKNLIPYLSRTLPLLDFASDYFKGILLESTLVICVQHLYETTYNMFKALFSKGLKPENLHVFGKCYSTDPRVYKQLEADGVHISPHSASFDSHVPYDKNFEENIRDFFKTIVRTVDLDAFEKVIILDDGGFLSHIANQLLPKHLNVVGVEQTAAGFHRIKRDQVFFPVINTAKSWVKGKYESPIIINLALKKLESKISHLDHQPQSVLIMGYGTLGQVVYNHLHHHYAVSYFDADPSKSLISKNDLKNLLKDFDLIIGTTGETSLSTQDFKYLKPSVVLASISSSDREFDSIHLRKKTAKTHNCHTDMQIGGITLLNAGFPINFDEDYAEIDTDDFQLTRALILSAVCQAQQTPQKEKGFIDLDECFQKALEQKLIKQ